MNEHEEFEIKYHQIRFNIAILEPKFNRFILHQISNCCHYRGKGMEKDGLVILN